jgi:She9 / Mdm33 family
MVLSPEATLSSTVNTKTNSAASSSSTASSSDVSLSNSQPVEVTSTTATQLWYDNTKKSFLQRLQDTWYERSGTLEILALKESVNHASLAFDQASMTVTWSRRHLDECIKHWERISGQHLQLLQRRESWTSEDAQTFAKLISEEVSSRHKLEQARHDLTSAEEILSQRQLDYMNGMRRRYHEEQIWQDKWRVVGTYGTWSLIVLNSVVFLASQYFLQFREKARMKSMEELIRESILQQQPTHHVLPSTTTIASTTTSENNTTVSASSSNPRYHATEQTREMVSTSNGHVATVPPETTQPKQLPPTEVDTTLEHPPGVGSWKEGTISLPLKCIQSTMSKYWQHAVLLYQSQQSKFQHLTIERPAAMDVVWDEMPKSLSDVHVPSAIVGASAMGVAVMIIMILFPLSR